jgi:hypothetical protein
MADEGRQISQGTNRGEAVFLGDSTFDPVANARRVGETMRMEREKRDVQQKEDLSLLNDNIKTKWDTDTFNYFEPRIGQLKSTIIDAFKNQEGKLTPIQRMEFKNAWDGIRNEAEVSNATFNAYANQVKMLDQNPDKFDLEESRANLNILRDPLSNPETKKEVEQMYGGNVLKWRADNAEKYALVPAYSREGFVQDLMKGKGLEAQAVYDRSADGKPIAYKTETGTYEYRGKKGVTDNQIKSKVEAIWGDTDRKSQRTRQQDLETVKEKFIIDEMGRPVLVDETDTLSQEVLKNANLKGKTTPDEIYKELGKSFTFTDLRQRFPQSDIRQPIANKPMGRTSGGKGFTDNYTVAETPFKMGDVNIAATLPGQSWINQAAAKGHNVRRVSLRPKKGVESFQLSISGKPVRPIGYIVDDQTGEVYMEYASKEQTGINQLTGTPIYKDVTGAKLVGQDIEADLAAEYGFSNYNEFKRNALGYKPKSQQSAQPSKPNTGGIKPVNNPLVTKKSR